MKFLIIALSAVSCVLAVEEYAAEVLKNVYEQNPEGGYRYALETSNGIYSEASAVWKQINKDEGALAVSGSNRYQSPEGETFELTFTADENGYQPQGNHLPTPPPPEAIPDYIQRSLEYIAAHPYQEKKV